MNKVVKFGFATFALISSSVASGGEFVNGFGSGIQYGGVVGWQSAYLSGKNKYKFSLGYTDIAGITLGYDRYLGPKASLGASYFANQFALGLSLNLNYHLSSVDDQGWLVGLDLYTGLDSGDLTTETLQTMFTPWNDNDFDVEAKGGALISVGYHF